MEILVEGLVKSFGEKKVFDGFSACFKAGECTLIMGKSGCGKTTLLRILMGLETVEAGSIRGVTGHRMGAVFQEERLLEDFSVLSNLRFACGKIATKEKIKDALERVGLAGSERQRVGELSGGMRRRVSLVRALLGGPELVFLDEPFSGLDIQTRQMAGSYLREELRGKTAIVVTHQREDGELLGAAKRIELTPA